jgi:hypothetical protein
MNHPWTAPVADLGFDLHPSILFRISCPWPYPSTRKSKARVHVQSVGADRQHVAGSVCRPVQFQWGITYDAWASEFWLLHPPSQIMGYTLRPKLWAWSSDYYTLRPKLWATPSVPNYYRCLNFFRYFYYAPNRKTKTINNLGLRESYTVHSINVSCVSWQVRKHVSS